MESEMLTGGVIAVGIVSIVGFCVVVMFIAAKVFGRKTRKEIELDEERNKLLRELIEAVRKEVK